MILPHHTPTKALPRGLVPRPLAPETPWPGPCSPRESPPPAPLVSCPLRLAAPGAGDLRGGTAIEVQEQSKTKGQETRGAGPSLRSDGDPRRGTRNPKYRIRHLALLWLATLMWHDVGMVDEQQRALFESTWRPRAPLAADCKTGPYRRRSRAVAEDLAYVEANPLVLRSITVIDQDTSDSDWAADLAGLPSPTWVAMNPHTTAGHIAYGLQSPVCLSDAAHRRPVRLLARIEEGLTTVLGGDVAYAGRIMKNPLSDAHTTIWGDGRLYGLHDLATALERLGALPAAGHPRQSVRRSEVGRNVALFDDTRQWAYRAVRRYWGGPASEWEAAVFSWAWSHNETVIAEAFTRGPLAAAEVTHVARSVARWTWRHMTPETWRNHQTAAARTMHDKRRQTTRATLREATR